MKNFTDEHARMYAAKWRADGHQGMTPTDEALASAFANCVRPAKPDEYPAIRKALSSCTECGAETIYRDGVCGDCREDQPVWTAQGPQTDRASWKFAAAVEAGHKVGRR